MLNSYLLEDLLPFDLVGSTTVSFHQLVVSPLDDFLLIVTEVLNLPIVLVLEDKSLTIAYITLWFDWF